MKTETLQARVQALEQMVNGPLGVLARLDGLDANVQHLSRKVEVLRGDVETLRGDVGELRREVAAGDEETRRLMRVLYEDTIARIGALRG